MPRKSNRLPIILGAVVVIGGVAYWQMHAHHDAQPRSESVMTVSVVSPKQGSLSQKIHLSGSVVPREEIVITAELANVRITEVFVDEGKWVKKGQPLAQLDHTSAANQLAQTEAEYKQAEQNYRRMERIKKTGAVSLSEVEEKRTAYESVKAQHDDALLKVKMATLTSPAAGLVYEREARIGALVGGNDPLFHIARDGNIELEASVAESDMVGLKTGQEVSVLLPGRQPIIGKIRLISPRVDSATRATRLRIALPHDPTIAIGSYAEAEIATHQASGLTLPQSAVNLVDGKSVIWIVGAEGKVSALPVTVTLRTGDSALVTAEGISADSKIVAKAGPFLHEGDMVTIAAEPTPEPAK